MLDLIFRNQHFQPLLVWILREFSAGQKAFCSILGEVIIYCHRYKKNQVWMLNSIVNGKFLTLMQNCIFKLQLFLLLIEN